MIYNLNADCGCNCFGCNGCCCACQTGATGATGATGSTGADGVQGLQGVQGIQGEKGDTGATGEQGIQGIQGIQGVQGEPGSVGTIDGSYPTYEDLVAAHPTGSAGNYYYVAPDLYIWDEDKGMWDNVGQIAGPQGIQGEQGVQGEQGATGATGSTGADGLQGEQGIQGEKGATGATGADGAQGEKGEKGDTGATGICDCSELQDRIDALEGRIVSLENQITNIIHSITPSAVRTVYSDEPALIGIGSSVIQTGSTYNYWGVDTLAAPTSLNNKQTYYIATTDQLPELKDYQGSPTITTMWIVTPNGNTYTQPVYFDETGVYFTPSSSLNNLPLGTSFKFTQALILAE
ncbi:MAG: collagen-like protein [Oscillospiraceae bacterium]|jgi:hypothetical protein|nr:collagen-like protein [Oscillospiraceae bacterium]